MLIVYKLPFTTGIFFFFWLSDIFSGSGHIHVFITGIITSALNVMSILCACMLS